MVVRVNRRNLFLRDGACHQSILGHRRGRGGDGIDPKLPLRQVEAIDLNRHGGSGEPPLPLEVACLKRNALCRRGGGGIIQRCAWAPALELRFNPALRAPTVELRSNPHLTARRRPSQQSLFQYEQTWRRGWDSNPRGLAAFRFSRPVQSTTLPPLQAVPLNEIHYSITPLLQEKSGARCGVLERRSCGECHRQSGMFM
jgi:hypothetical protein